MSEQQFENSQDLETSPDINPEEENNLQENSNVSDESEKPEGVETKEIENEELTPEMQKKLGRALSAQRKHLRQEHARELAVYAERLKALNYGEDAPSSSESETIFDPETGEYVSVNTAIGQIIQRNYKIAAKRKELNARAEADKLVTAVEEGFSRFEHDKYDQARQTFINLGTDAMAEALKGADDASAIINYLGSKPNEIKRIAQLSPAKQMREIHRIDDFMTPRKKMVTNASPPMGSINTNRNYATDIENQSFQQRADYWEKIINQR